MIIQNDILKGIAKSIIENNPTKYDSYEEKDVFEYGTGRPYNEFERFNIQAYDNAIELHFYKCGTSKLLTSVTICTRTGTAVSRNIESEIYLASFVRDYILYDDERSFIVYDSQE